MNFNFLFFISWNFILLKKCSGFKRRRSDQYQNSKETKGQGFRSADYEHTGCSQPVSVCKPKLFRDNTRQSFHWICNNLDINPRVPPEECLHCIAMKESDPKTKYISSWGSQSFYPHDDIRHPNQSVIYHYVSQPYSSPFHRSSLSHFRFYPTTQETPNGTLFSSPEHNSNEITLTYFWNKDKKEFCSSNQSLEESKIIEYCEQYECNALRNVNDLTTEKKPDTDSYEVKVIIFYRKHYMDKSKFSNYIWDEYIINEIRSKHSELFHFIEFYKNVGPIWKEIDTDNNIFSYQTGLKVKFCKPIGFKDIIIYRKKYIKKNNQSVIQFLFLNRKLISKIQGLNWKGDKVFIMKGCKIGKNVTLYGNTYIGPECIIGEHSEIYKGCFLKKKVEIGLRTRIKFNNYIGENCKIGALGKMEDDSSSDSDQKYFLTVINDNNYIENNTILLPGCSYGNFID